MKTTCFVLTAMAIIIASAVSATKIPTLTISQTEKNKVLVHFEASEPDVVRLSIKNSQGEVVYSKKSETPVTEFHRIFDFHYNHEGDYEVCVDYYNCTISRKITLSNQRLVNVEKEERAFTPFYSFEDNLLKISYLNNNLQNVHMSIIHEGNHLARKNLGNSMCIQKAFDLSKLENGQYEIVLSNRNDHYQFVINK